MSKSRGLPPGEGVFLACSFWLVEVLALQGRLDEAQALFERLLGLRNDRRTAERRVRSEARDLLGNFPQAFTHLALVEAALTLAEHRSPRGVASRVQLRARPSQALTPTRHAPLTPLRGRAPSTHRAAEKDGMRD